MLCPSHPLLHCGGQHVHLCILSPLILEAAMQRYRVVFIPAPNAVSAPANPGESVSQTMAPTLLTSVSAETSADE